MSDRRPSRKPKGDFRRGGSVRGSTTRGSRGRGVDANTQEEDNNRELNSAMPVQVTPHVKRSMFPRKTAQVLAHQSASDPKNPPSFPMAYRLPEESSSTSGTLDAAANATPTSDSVPTEKPLTLPLSHDVQSLGTTPRLPPLVRSISSASSGTGASDVTWTTTPPPTTRRESRASKSEFWQYFTKRTLANGEVRAYCHFCSVSYKVPCTSNMGNHMMSSHSTKIVPNDQPTLVNRQTNQLELVKPFTNEYAKEALLEMIIINNHPFTLVEEESFIKFCAILNPSFRLTKSTALRNAIFRRYVSERKNIIQYFRPKSIGMVSATTDLWTSGNNLAMMAVTVTWLTFEFFMKEVTIGFRELKGGHSGVNIANCFLSVLTEFGLQSKLLCLTTDNASSNGTFIEELVRLTQDFDYPFEKENWIRCLAHILNLASQDALERLKPNIEKLRNLSIEIRASPQRIALFKSVLMADNFDIAEEIRNDEETSEEENPFVRVLLPLRDVPTRWNSTLSVLKRGIKIKKALDATTTQREWRGSEIHEDEWEKIKEAVELLDPFALTTRFLEGYKYPTLGAVLPLFTKLLMILHKWNLDVGHSTESREAALAATEKLKKYYKRLTSVYIVATVLDARLKVEYFNTGLRWEVGDSDSSEIDMVKAFVLPALEKACAKYKNNPALTLHETTRASELSSTSQENKKSELNEYLSDLYSVKKRARLEDELQDYLAEPREPSDASYDNLSYWREHTTCYPRLSCMTRDYLAITATSASSERVFSAGKDLLGICRFCLNATTMEACMCLRSWLRAGIKLLEGQDLNYTNDNIPACNKASMGSTSAVEEISQHFIEEEEVIFIEGDEWSENEYYTGEDTEFASNIEKQQTNFFGITNFLHL